MNFEILIKITFKWSLSEVCPIVFVLYFDVLRMVERHLLSFIHYFWNVTTQLNFVSRHRYNRKLCMLVLIKVKFVFVCVKLGRTIFLLDKTFDKKLKAVNESNWGDCKLTERSLARYFDSKSVWWYTQ